jgi:hypothetical protein
MARRREGEISQELRDDGRYRVKLVRPVRLNAKARPIRPGGETVMSGAVIKQLRSDPQYADAIEVLSEQ